MSNDVILSAIKLQIQQIVPQAKILLFGSRAYGIPMDESDWDILILIKQPVTSGIKNRIHTALFPVSVQIGAFINAMAIQETEWVNNPSYYSLQQTVSAGMVQI